MAHRLYRLYFLCIFLYQSKLKEKEAAGEITTEGANDVLTLALEKPKHPGRVRGVGGNVKPAAYFNLPPRQRQTVEETIRKNVQKILEEEREKILAQERAIWMERLMRLEAKIEGKSLPNDSPKPATPKNEHVSGQGSCSKQGLKAEIGVEIVKETAKKFLDLGDDENMGREEKVKETDGEKNMVPILEKINKRMHAKEGQIDQMVNTVFEILIYGVHLKYYIYECMFMFILSAFFM